MSMKCSKCDIEMSNPSYQGESYYTCSKCGKVEFDFNIGNTFTIDTAFSLESK